MAVGETAKLIASLELQDKFSKTADTATRKLGGLEGVTQRAGRQMGIFGHAVSTAMGIGLARAVSSGVGFLSRQVSEGVAALNELESVTVASNTVIASTKGVAGQTAEGIRNLAEKYESLNATIDDKVIQSGENLLLTFTNIRKDAFEPALEAALNMNEAMGGGPEGLQSTIIQVGKALNDPIKGATALRRVGVQLSDEQQKQIKVLMEQNDLYGAQQIILEELGTEFGGRFAAAGDTALGKQAALRDSIEDLQKSFAGPLIPAIDKVRDKLIDLFRSPAAEAATSKLGEAIAGIFTDQNLTRASDAVVTGLDKLSTFDFTKIGDGVNKVFGFLGDVPWGTIAEGMQITGQATKGIIDAFLTLPKEVQGVIVAALAVNKLSGGIAGGLAKGLGGVVIDIFKGRGTTPVNPLFVAPVGGSLGGGGIPGIGGGAPVAGKPFLPTGALGWASLVGVAIADAFLIKTAIDVGNEQVANVAVGSGFQKGVVADRSRDATVEELRGLRADLKEQEAAGGGDPIASLAKAIFVNPILNDQIADVETQIRANTAAVTSGQAEERQQAWQRTQNTINEFRQASNQRRAEHNKVVGQANRALSNDQAMLATARTQTARIQETARQTATVAQRVAEGRAATQTGFTSMGGRLDTANARLTTVANKNFSPTVRVNVTSNVSISEVQRKIISQQIAIGRGFLEGTG